MLTSLTFTILQTGMCNFEFHCHYPPWYLRYTHGPLKNVHFVSLERNENLPRLPLVLIGNWAAAWLQLRLILSYDWIEFRRLDTSCGWFCPPTESSFGCWIRVAADPILRMTSCGLFYPAADSSSGGWMQVASDSITRLTRVPAAG